MARTAEQRGVTIVSLDELHREVAPLNDLRAIVRLAN